MNMPVRQFLERHMLMKLKWENLNHVIPLPAKGTDLSNIKPNRDEILEINLTPHQLKIAPDSRNWVWFRKASEYDEPLKTAKEITLERVQRIYEFYAPHLASKAETMVRDHEGREDLMFLRLTQMYGPEPSKEQWRRKMMLSGRGGTAGARSLAGPSAGGGGGGGGGYNNSDTASAAALSLGIGADNGLLAMLMGRTSSTMMMITYFRKWLGFRRKRKDVLRVCYFMTGNMDNLIRREYFSKLKSFHATRRMKRQLQVSSQMAYKSESLVGDLATENMFLKNEVKKLRAQVEVLDNANSKRLETLFSSSEAAIREIKALTQENEQKELLINKLEAKLMNVGNMMLKAEEQRDLQLEAAQKERLAMETVIDELRQKQAVLEEGLAKSREQLAANRPKTPPKTCMHCEHYTEVVREADVLREHHKRLAHKVEDIASERHKLAIALENLQKKNEELQLELNETRQREQQLQATLTDREYGRPGDRRASLPRETSGYQERDQQAQLQRSNTFSSQGGEGPLTPATVTSTAQDRGFERQSSQQRIQSGNPLDQGQNRSGGVTSYRDPYGNASFTSAGGGLASGGGSFYQDPRYQQQQQQQQPQQSSQQSQGLVYDSSGVSRPAMSAEETIPKASVSLQGFFAREEQLSREKMKMFIDRHAQQRVGGLPVSTPRPQGVTSLQVQQALAAATSLDRHPVAAVNTMGHDALAQTQFAHRPQTNAAHSQYGVGKTEGTPRQMMSNVFAFKR